jgi:hypothetical protein
VWPSGMLACRRATLFLQHFTGQDGNPRSGGGLAPQRCRSNSACVHGGARDDRGASFLPRAALGAVGIRDHGRRRPSRRNGTLRQNGPVGVKRGQRRGSNWFPNGQRGGLANFAKFSTFQTSLGELYWGQPDEPNGRQGAEDAGQARTNRASTIHPPTDELAAIDEFRYRARMPSLAAAIRELLRRGLASAEKEPE